MLQVVNTAFKADTRPQQTGFNTYTQKSQMPDMSYQNDILDMQMALDKDARKKQRRQDNLQKWGVYGTVTIGVALIAQVAISLYGIFKNKGMIDKELTTAKIVWEDFKNKKTVASLDSETTSQALKKTFHNIMDGSKLSEKAKRWCGRQSNETDVIYLYGHGGVGKTYVAQQYAQEIGALFTSVKYPNIGSPYKDAASMKISNLFDQIIEKANKNKDRKIVVCIDEIDAVIKKVKDTAHGSDEASKSRAAVLTGIDRLREKCKNVTVIATSNYHPKNGIIDEIALNRRFNNLVEVPLPDKTQINALLKMYLNHIEAITKTDFLKKPEFEQFVSKLYNEGYSNGEIKLIASEAEKIFSSTLKDAKDAELETKHKFKIDYLEEALKMKGDAASKTNELMTVRTIGDNNQGQGPKLNFWQKFLIKLANIK